MFLGRVVGNADTDANPLAREHGLKIVQKLDLYRNPCGHSTIAINFIGANDGDIVIVGSPEAGRPASGTGNTADSQWDSTILGILEKPSPSAAATKRPG